MIMSIFFLVVYYFLLFSLILSYFVLFYLIFYCVFSPFLPFSCFLLFFPPSILYLLFFFFLLLYYFYCSILTIVSLSKLASTFITPFPSTLKGKTKVCTFTIFSFGDKSVSVFHLQSVFFMFIYFYF